MMTDDGMADLRKSLIEAGVPQIDLGHILDAGGPVWQTADLTNEFDVLSFAAPFVLVRRKSDGVQGTLEFIHQPRLYFDFIPT